MRKVTIKEVAAEAGVSTATVSRVLNNSGTVNAEMKEQVLAAMKRLNYQPNAIARSLKREKTNTIGIVIPDISNSFFMQLAKGIEETVSEEGYNLIFCSSDEKPEKERKLLQLLQEKRVDAIVLATAGQNACLVRDIRTSGIPIVLVDRKIDGEDGETDIVLEDNVQGAFLLTSHLIRQGHRRIGVINGSLDVSTGLDRYSGYIRAMRHYGLETNVKYIFNGNFSQGDGSQAADYFLSLHEKPTAIISFNNKMAFGALLELLKRQMRIPDDMALASYGEVEAAQLLRDPGIAYIDQNPYAMGLKAGQFLLRRLKQKNGKPFKEMFAPVLKVR